jgi:hypothetical protein
VEAVLGARARGHADPRGRNHGLATSASGLKGLPPTRSALPPGTCSPCAGAFADRLGDAFRAAPEDVP